MVTSAKTTAPRTTRTATAASRKAAAKAPAAKRPAAPAPTSKAPARPVKKASTLAPQAANAETSKPAQADKPAKVADKAAEKAKKPKLVRDSFTIPKAEYEVIAALKLRAAKLGQTPKKSELLRAGIKVLAAMGDPAFLASLAAVPSIKTGRPAA